jgi:signal transduction histidine kinase
MPAQKWLNATSIAIWIVCGIYPITFISAGPIAWWPGGAWIAGFLLYGAALLAFLWLPRGPAGSSRALRIALAATQSVLGAVLHYLSGTRLGGTGVVIGLLILVAAEIPFILPYRTVWAWIGVQSLVVMLMFVPGDSPAGIINTVAFGIAMAGFQVFAAASSMLLRRAHEASRQLAAANAELRATRAMLAEHSRAAERLRISRDLHDTLGHHLTALSLQLDVASRLSDDKAAAGKAADHVRQAHAITRLLLADVRDVVGCLRETGRVDVAEAIRALVIEQTGTLVHLDLPVTLGVDDPGRADALIRCVQEILTNTARHAAARNLWIRLEVRPDGVVIDAHDDGRGAASIDCGHGLTGMRERFEEHAGHVDYSGAPGSGFRVHGFLPMPAGA